MESINIITNQIQKHPQLKLLDDNLKVVLARELIYQQVNERVRFFDKCLDEISLIHY